MDVRAKLGDISLQELPLDCLPDGALFASSGFLHLCPPFAGQRVDQLATELQGLKGAGHANPVVYVDLKKHVPRWATNEPRDVQGDDEQPLSKEIANAVARSINPGVGAEKKVPLSWNQWLLAFPRYAIEAAVGGMVPYTASMGHMVSSTTACLRLLSIVSFRQSVRGSQRQPPLRMVASDGLQSFTTRWDPSFSWQKPALH